MLATPPLGLYVHLPWCVAKCPYCDFNSYAQQGALPEMAYVDAVLADLELELPQVWGRVVSTVFIGGGTPSLFSAQALDCLLSGIRARLSLSPDAEITLEANPGSVEHDRFEDYLACGINRISLGIQSFNDEHLRRLGRIHDSVQADRAIQAVVAAGFDNFNLDLMWALPGQTPDQALTDLDRALSWQPPHLSHYQLTIEPNTLFAARPPLLPDEEQAWTIQEQAAERLGAAGYEGYEISAWAQPGRACRHNLNYWRFGDYIGIGAGAHGKLTLAGEGRILRTRRKAHPRSYLNAANEAGFIAELREVESVDRAFEYFLNRLRLAQPISWQEFSARTGLASDSVAEAVTEAVALGLLEVNGHGLRRTERGASCLNDLQALFLPRARAEGTGRRLMGALANTSSPRAEGTSGREVGHSPVP